MSVCVTERERNQFPSVLLQPLSNAPTQAFKPTSFEEERDGQEPCTSLASDATRKLSIPHERP